MTNQEILRQENTKNKSDYFKNPEDIFANCASTVDDKYHWSNGPLCWREESSYNDLKEHSWK